MDQKKILEFLQQAYPKFKVVEDKEQTYADSDAPDVDVSNPSLAAWRKFGPSETEKVMAPDSKSDPREMFRVRKLTGAGPARSGAEQQGPLDTSRTPGKLTLKQLVPEAAADDTDDTLDVLVDEEHGIIGESDSGPDDDK